MLSQKAVIDQVQTYSTPKNEKEVQAFSGILSFGVFLFLPSLILAGKKKKKWVGVVCVELGIRTASTFEKVKILVRQIKSLAISQEGLVLDVSVTPEGVDWAL